MARLIDADKLREKDMNGDVVDIFDVLEAPTVEAIPIDWIREKSKDYMNNLWYRQSIRYMLDVWYSENRDWEKENE